MKVVVLAGGFGTRISEESHLKPKPMINIGEKPILWHILKIYSAHGFNEFIICMGYKGYVIKDYFLNYYLHKSDITIDLQQGNQKINLVHGTEPWKITLAETGLESMTGERIRKIRSYVGHEPFMLTYGDGLADVNIQDLMKFHKSHGKIATVTAVQPSGRFGALQLANDQRVESFKEKEKGDGGWINGGFFIFQPEVFDFIPDNNAVFEKEPLENLAKAGHLMAYKHSGFWHPMDTMRDKKFLEELWKLNKAPWKIWK